MNNNVVNPGHQDCTTRGITVARGDFLRIRINPPCFLDEIPVVVEQQQEIIVREREQVQQVAESWQWEAAEQNRPQAATREHELSQSSWRTITATQDESEEGFDNSTVGDSAVGSVATAVIIISGSQRGRK